MEKCFFRHLQNRVSVVCTVIFFSIPFIGTTQICPVNLDVELGDFTNWQCYAGNVAAVGNTNSITVSPSGPITGQHLVYSNQTSTLDAYGQFPQTCPNGSGYSIKLGNDAGGKFAEQISYTFTIPSTAYQYSLLYWYAVVFQNPDHQDYQQPRFVANVYDETAGVALTCASFTYVGSSGLPGFQQSAVNRDVVFKPWTPVTVNLNGLAGHTIRLEFTTADCTQGGHFGYAYLDVNSQCSQPVKGATYCRGDNSVTLDAPFGFQGYTWLNAAGQTLGNDQTLILSPAPADGTVLSVALQPYAGFGCVDTIQTVIRQVDKPLAVAGPDTTFCEGTAVKLGTQHHSNWQYNWLPTEGLSNPTGGITLASPALATQYVLNVTDSSGGCSASDTVLVAPVKIDTDLAVKGDTLVCEPGNIDVWLQLSTTASVQWYNHSQMIPGEMGTLLQATTSGFYHAVITQSGCVAGTRPVTIQQLKKPSAFFSLVNTSPCLPSNSLTAQAGSTGDSKWDWGDGSISTGNAATHKYGAAGIFDVRHIITSADGCADTSMQSVTILPVPEADFDVTGNCAGVPTLFLNKTAYNGSALVSYQWIFPPGDTVHNFQPTHTFLQTGSYTIRLQSFSADCPDDISEVRKRVTISPPPKGQRKTINAVLNEPIRLMTLSKGKDYVWTPATYLDNNLVAQPIFNGQQSIEYNVKMVNDAGCPLTDTVAVKLFNEGNVWVPSAFTPDGDGRNDRLYPVLAGMERLVFFRVWNRWGQLVFQTSAEGSGWDGKVDGKLLSTDNFVWSVEAISNKGVHVFKKGNVVLVR